MAIFLSSIALLSFSFAFAGIVVLIITPEKIRTNACSMAFLLAAVTAFSESPMDDAEVLALFRLLKDEKTDVTLDDCSIVGDIASPSAREGRVEDIEIRGDRVMLIATVECGATSVAILVNMKVRKV